MGAIAMTKPQHAADPNSGGDPHALVGAYALDALTPDEREQFEAHLATCTACQTEVSDFRETLAETAAVTQTAPPQRLRADILASIATVRQLDPQSQTANHPTNSQSVGDFTNRTSIPSRDPGQVVIRPARWRRVTEIAVAAVVAIVLAIGGWTVGRHQQSQTVQADQSAQQRLLSAPDARIYHQPMPGGAKVAYIISRSRNAGMVAVSGRPDPGAGHVFQLWTMHTEHGKTVPEPDRTFTGQQTQPIWLTGSLANAIAVAITIEPDGGSKHPTTNPFALQQL